jgi:DNA-binding NarL/FixJ family response regulator
MSISVLIVDNHDVVRQGLAKYLKLDPKIAVVDKAANGKELFVASLLQTRAWTGPSADGPLLRSD